ncbi:small multi-drug export protein [Bacillus fonticola]|uniref:small multi-drug export protein n=1 Tax=Bacillus fonticola TaxID=2728853 RepID=UPI001472C822|nr:small multi-drug export protein [Bacillus fonticola]
MNLLEYALVFLLAAIPWVEIALVIPLGIVRDLNPVLVVLIAFIGNISTIWLVVHFYEKIDGYRAKKRKGERVPSKRFIRAKDIWNKYGLPGIAFLGPILIGTHIAAFVGLLLGAQKNWTFAWVSGFLLLWSVLFGLGSYYGVEWLIRS